MSLIFLKAVVPTFAELYVPVFKILNCLELRSEVISPAFTIAVDS